MFDVQTWQAMTDLFLADNDSIQLSEREQLLLARLINACVKKASGVVICPKSKTDPDIVDSKVPNFVPSLRL
jgi:hypothetical protein